ncbi:MAG: hypothetical protein A2Y56_10870 [Candidatus Aminicenantes bacterium RBG_13_63_10]|nr:MAG: hypothetical protein A2Y56_10870 [Candidatus Aminicenantes bacterium RBG_13_63_10]
MMKVLSITDDGVVQASPGFLRHPACSSDHCWASRAADGNPVRSVFLIRDSKTINGDVSKAGND